jgi:hypothetical protein
MSNSNRIADEIRLLHSRSFGSERIDLREPAEFLLNTATLVVDNARVRICEIEFYCYSPEHADPYVHRHPLQWEAGRWYLHRIGDGFRGGSFKGLDISFGNQNDVFGGILIRSIITDDGKMVCGPSLCVDHLLQRLSAGSVAELDELVAHNDVWSASNRLRLEIDCHRSKPVFQSARVGLSLTSDLLALQSKYFARSYRFLTEPKLIKKGRPHLILGLAQHYSANEISKLTGSKISTVERYLAQSESTFDGQINDLADVRLSTQEYCRVHGHLLRTQSR